mmetsp:Transcript_49267/g.130503  ORF Transcript_49267/g.130503 Transcript_49267/m.130503 type:complete len:267 (-) Transcript_49267:2480-3280(-)
MHGEDVSIEFPILVLAIPRFPLGPAGSDRHGKVPGPKTLHARTRTSPSNSEFQPCPSHANTCELKLVKGRCQRSQCASVSRRPCSSNCRSWTHSSSDSPCRSCHMCWASTWASSGCCCGAPLVSCQTRDPRPQFPSQGCCRNSAPHRQATHHRPSDADRLAEIGRPGQLFLQVVGRPQTWLPPALPPRKEERGAERWDTAFGRTRPAPRVAGARRAAPVGERCRHCAGAALRELLGGGDSPSEAGRLRTARKGGRPRGGARPSRAR